MVMCCRGEPYFMLESLAELHTAEAWKMKEGREASSPIHPASACLPHIAADTIQA